jgi:hypothetical protein
MFGLQILDVVIGLFFGYLVLSLAVTAANELGAAWFRRRAWMLRKGVANLLADDRLVDEFYKHSLIRSLSVSEKGPSYIPSRTFAMALLDVVAPRANGTRLLPSKEEAKAKGPLHQTLALLADESDGDPERFRQHIETWFNDSMDRVSGWYKRRTQFFLVAFAIVVTVGTNADTLVIAKALWRDTALRQAVVASAERYLAEEARPSAAPAVATPIPSGDGAPIPPLPPDQQADIDFEVASTRYDAAMADLAELQLPIGWEDPAAAPAVEDADTDAPRFRLVREDATDDWPGPIWAPGGLGRWMRALDQHLLGWLITVLAISLGAPFWFDTLNRIMAIRSAGRAPEEAQRAPKEVPRPKEPGEK